jgi:hypothetical protein
LWLPVALVLGGLLVAAVLGLTAYKVGASVLRKHSAQILGGRRAGRAEADGAEPVVVEVVGSEVVVEPQTEEALPALPTADSAPETAESESGPEPS